MQELVATLSSSSVVDQTPALSEVSLPSFSTSAASQVISSPTILAPTSSAVAASQAVSPVVIPVPISSGVVQVLGAGGDTADEFAPVTLNPNSPAPTGTAKYPTAAGGNIPMANGFNSIYERLNLDTPCDPGDPSQVYACVEGEIAECQSDATYVVKSCPRGQSCYALPKPSGFTGVVVQCAIPSDAASALHGLSSSTGVSAVVTSQPAQMLQTEGDFSQATQSVSAQNPGQLVTSSLPEQVTIQSQIVAPTPSVLAMTAIASGNQGSAQVNRFAVSTGATLTSTQPAVQTEPQVLYPSVLSVAPTSQQVHDSNSLNDPPQSNLPPQAQYTTAAVLSVPQAMFAVVTAPVNNEASPSANTAQASVATSQASQPYPRISSLAALSPAMLPQVSSNSVQLTDVSVTSTSTSSADGTDITSAPAGISVNDKAAVNNGQATVTVTVTVTTTEMSAPITIVAP